MGSVVRQMVGSRITIRRVKEADASQLEPQVSRKKVSRWTTHIPYPYPPGGAIKFIRRSQRQWRLAKSYTFCIGKNETGSPMGVISLSAVSPAHQCAELGYWLGSDHWGQGFMTEAVTLALRFAFEELRLYRVYASTFEANRASCRVLEKAGFQLEGRMREAIVRYGKRHDFLNYGILKSEFGRDF